MTGAMGISTVMTRTEGINDTGVITTTVLTSNTRIKKIARMRLEGMPLQPLFPESAHQVRGAIQERIHLLGVYKIQS